VTIPPDPLVRPRQERPRRGRPFARRAAIVVAIGIAFAIAFALGVALGEALHENPKPRRQDRTLTIIPETGTATTSAP
jgi:hypothetical protein